MSKPEARAALFCGNEVVELEGKVAAAVLEAVGNRDNAITKLLAALEEMCATFKPFRLRPVGGEGSAARLDQENQIAVHEAAMKVIAEVKSRGLRR